MFFENALRLDMLAGSSRLYVVRTFATLFLVWLILDCPVLCRATDEGCCADGEATAEDSDEPLAPAPDDAPNCICGGAIKAPSLRVHGHDSESFFPAPDTLNRASLDQTDFSLSKTLARDGTPAASDA